MNRIAGKTARLWRKCCRQWRTGLSVSLPLFLVWVFLFAPIASVQGDQNGVFQKRLYVGFGAGISSLDPDSTCPCLTVDDGTDQSFSLFLGYDLASRLSVEAHYSDLGAAGIAFQGSRVGDIDYSVAGVSVVGYLFGTRRNYDEHKIRALDSKEGLSGYVRAGVGAMQNDSDLPYNRDYRAHFLTGLGLEYGWANGLAARIEVVAHDSDAIDAGLRLLKRFGDNGKRALTTRSVPAIKALDSTEKSDATPLPVEREMELPLLYFEFAEFTLTDDSKAALNVLADDLTANPERNIVIDGHADDIDTEDFNIELSINRAAAVKRYLMGRGIEAMRMVISGYGESQPVASNLTEEGRAKNRRVEIYSR